MNCFLGGFLLKPKLRFLGGQNKMFLKQFALVLQYKRKLNENFPPKIFNIQAPWIKKNCYAHAPAQHPPKFWIWTSTVKSYLTFGNLPSSDRSKRKSLHTYCTTQIVCDTTQKLEKHGLICVVTVHKLFCAVHCPKGN